jgi:Ca2+-binding EF-hand superfamily protein|tara:strand:+ start:20630 stop:21139 length:510 start_codon:yes stop_codon:yes gene_type:complete
MTRKTIIAAAVLAVTAFGGAAFAQSNHGHGDKAGKINSQGMMMQGGGMMGDMSEMQGMMQRMHENMTQMMDADGDGTVTPEEMRGMMQAKLTENDADGNGSLSIEEFETLHSAMMRNMMVDRFQHLDADGDGAVTPEEMMAPAAMMERMQKMQGGSMMPDGQSDDGEKD